MDTRALVALSLSEAEHAAQELSRLKGFNLKSLQGAIACTTWAVKRAEQVGLKEGLTGADKKEFAIELLLRAVPMPWYLQALVRMVLPPIIDAIVDALKDKFA